MKTVLRSYWVHSAFLHQFGLQSGPGKMIEWRISSHDAFLGAFGQNNPR